MKSNSLFVIFLILQFGVFSIDCHAQNTLSIKEKPIFELTVGTPFPYLIWIDTDYNYKRRFFTPRGASNGNLPLTTFFSLRSIKEKGYLEVTISGTFLQNKHEQFFMNLALGKTIFQKKHASINYEGGILTGKGSHVGEYFSSAKYWIVGLTTGLVSKWSISKRVSIQTSLNLLFYVAQADGIDPYLVCPPTSPSCVFPGNVYSGSASISQFGLSFNELLSLGLSYKFLRR